MTTQELIASTLRVLRNQATDTQPITAARVGLALRRAFGGPVWEELGFDSLRSFLEDLEKKGHLRIGQTDKRALAVQLGDSGEFNLTPPNDYLGVSETPSRPLLKPYWIAFALEHPKGKRFINPNTGELRIGVEKAPSSEGTWIEVEPIDGDTQRVWAENFLKENNVEQSDAIAAALSSEEWYREFPLALRSHPGYLATKWNRERSKRIALEVRNWCKKNGVPIQSAFQPRLRKPSSLNKTKTKSFAYGEFQNEEKMRRIVMRAISSAPTEWLLELPIPVKYVFRALNNQRK